MSQKPKLAVYIGRFSPFHNGHLEVIKHAAKTCDELLIIIGSAEQPRTIKNPWTASERAQIIARALRERENSETSTLTVHYQFAHDFPYNDTLWLNQVNGFIDKFYDMEPVLIGSDRDNSTYYLSYFPHLTKSLIPHQGELDLNATAIREAYFGSILSTAYLSAYLSATTLAFMESFKTTLQYALLVEEYEHIKSYKEQWAVAPYPPTFVTVDSVVTVAGHVLLIKRRAAPGKGLIALPGGFLNQDERALDGAIRELREETGLKVPAPVLKGSMIKKEVFDKPDRSLRGRTVTIAFHFALAELGVLPPIKGGDDALKAFWVPLSKQQTMREQMFEDHHSIIDTMVGGG